LKRVDYAGKRIGGFVVLRPEEKVRKGKGLFWVCLCDCGKEWAVRADVLKSEIIRSCGCLNLAKDLVGQKFGVWTVTERVESSGRGTQRFMCLCECGTIKTVRRRELINGLSKSCGCRVRKGDLAPLRALISSYRKSAESRHHEWNLSEDQVREITGQACHYCGIPPFKTWKTNTGASYQYNGIDRIDTTAGYTPKNVVPCCQSCNFAKHIKTVDEFKEWITQVYKHFVAK
jgi:hypothetical protein